MKRPPAIVVALVLAWAGCKDSTAPAAAPASLVVPDSAVVLESDSTQLHAKLSDSTGHVITDPVVVWVSGDTSVVTVSASGMVHFRSVGRTTIGVLSGSLTGHVTVTAAVQFAQLDLGSVYAQLSPTACGITARGSLYCLNTERGDSLTLLPTASPLSQVAVGTSHSCVLSTAGAAYCWGTNSWGELGYDTALVGSPPVDTPVPVRGGHVFTALTAGVNHTCGLTASGAAYCWGLNNSAQLGNGDSSVQFSSTPLLVAGGLTFRSIAAGDDHTCGVTAGGAYCWGSNSHVGLGGGDSTITRSYAPVAVSGGAGFKEVVAGDNYGCALSSAGVASCWGDGEFGQLGIDTTNLGGCPSIPSGFVCSTLPQPVSGAIVFSSLAAHSGLGNGLDGLTCGLTASGNAFCWGRNLVGEVGDGTTTRQDTPVAVAGGLTFTRLVAGDFHACGFTAAGTVYCWGYTMGLTPVRIPDQP